MIVYEFKAILKKQQRVAIDEAIRITQFVRNKCLRFWMDNIGVKPYDLNKYTKVLAKEFGFAEKLNSMARQAAAERTAFAIKRFFDCKAKIPGKKGYPQFQKNNRSVEYKTCGWKLSENRKYITFTDKCDIGKVKVKGTYDLHFYQLKQIKRVRIVKRSDGCYIQFCIDAERYVETQPTDTTLGIDVGLNHFYTDSKGNKVENPRYLRKSEKALKRLQRRVSKKKKGSSNRNIAIKRLGKKHLKVSRQRKDYAVKLARWVVMSNDFVAYEELKVSRWGEEASSPHSRRNMVRNSKLSKSISDASWSIFTNWLSYFGNICGKVVVAVPPQYTSQNCSSCGGTLKKSLSVRTHICKCGCTLDRDENAARNILAKGLRSTAYKTNTAAPASKTAVARRFAIAAGGAEIKALGQNNLCLVSESLQNKLTG